MTVFALIEAKELANETSLGFHGNGDNLRCLALTAALKDKSGTGVVPVVPGSFDEETPYMTVAGLGDGATILSVAGGELRRDKAEVGHE